MTRNEITELALEFFTVELDEHGIATATLDDADEPFNTVSSKLTADMETILGHCERSSDIRGLVFASGKPKSFIVGANIKELDGITAARQGAELSRRSQDLFARVAGLTKAFGKPVVAAIDGPALGGGLELALACSHRIASDRSHTKLALPEVQLGLIPGAGGTQRLPRLIGVANALDMILTGKNVRPSKAARLGLVDEVVPAAILIDRARALALAAADGKESEKRGWARVAEIAQGLTDTEYLQQLALEENGVGLKVLFRKAREKLIAKTRGNYPAPEAALDVIRIGATEGESAGYAAESERFGELLMSSESKALISIFFGQTALKRDSGVDSDAEPEPVERVGVLGGGLMGGGIALVSVARAGVAARIKEVDGAGMRRGLSYVERALNKDVSRRRLTSFDAVRTLNQVTATDTWNGFEGTSIVIEAVFEDLELKREMVRAVEEHGGPKTIFASNTSSIPISEIASAAKHPERVIGMHYFSPVEKMPLLEIITTEQTADWVTATCVAAGKAQGKTVIVVNDGTGFYTSRILAPYVNEAAWMFAEGVPLEAIDEALLDFGFPVGPVTLLDEVGIDVGAKVAEIMHAAFGERVAAPKVMASLVADGRQGRKNRKGMYSYDSSGKKGDIDDSVYDVAGISPGAAPPAEEIRERIAFQMVNEAALAFGDGILRSTRDGDIGAVFGLGFPPFRGGPFAFIDSYGAENFVRRMEQLRERHGARFAVAPVVEDAAKAGRRFRDESPA